MGHHTMDGRADSLAMCVHLLAKPGHAICLQHALDQLQEWICLDVHLFLVSERTSPIKYYEPCNQKSVRFPGTSVLLFLHECGEERIFQVHDFFHNPPWQRVHIEYARKKLPLQTLEQDFYELDEHMPVWGLRQVHYGTEILRVTLYCSFDNYDDAVRLYEMILQKEATVQKSSFCAFVLYTTQSIAVQLCLKQLPAGMSVDSKESSVLQFKVHEIGQLVPLLPNPCVPISSTRWQTEDYEGNRILLQVQGVSNHSENQGSSCSWHSTCKEGNISHYRASPSPLATRRIAIKQKNQTLRAMKNKHKSTQGLVHTLASPCSPSQTMFCSSSQPHRVAEFSLPHLGPSQLTLATQWRHSSHELWVRQREEEEMNVDTGNKVLSSECRGSPLNSFSKDLQNGLPQSKVPCCSFLEAEFSTCLQPKERHSLTLPIAKKNQTSVQRQPDFCLETSAASHGTDEEEEEEFFI